jgi:salicylate hydroxylase
MFLLFSFDEEERMRVIIVGAGIGGLTGALTLVRAGIDVSVFEQASELREVGAGIMTSPNATRILDRLGLAESLRKVGFRPAARQLRRWDDGRVLASAPLAGVCEREFGAPYYNFHRAELLEVLAHAVPAGILHLGHRCVAHTQRKDRVEVHFHDDVIAEAEVLVGADGIHSTVRNMIFGAQSAHFSGDVAYRALISIDRLPNLEFQSGWTNWIGPNRHFTQYLVGADGRYLSVTASVPGKPRLESWTARGNVADWLAEFVGWHPQVQAIISAAETTNTWALYDRDPLPQWSVGRVTLLGDAAHAMLPYMAQGAAQSIEDAAVLAKCLARADRKDIGMALRRYEEIRKPRTSRCQDGSRQNGFTMHLPDGEEQRRRDASFSDTIMAGVTNRTWLYSHDVEAQFEQW